MTSDAQFTGRAFAVLLLLSAISSLNSATISHQKALGVNPSANSPEALFAKYDVDHNGYLNLRELTQYVIDSNEIFSKEAFKVLYKNDQKYREVVDSEALEEAKKIGRYGIRDPNRADDYMVTLDQFKAYLFGKEKAKKEKVDFLKKLTDGSLTDTNLHISKTLTVGQSADGKAAEPARFAWTRPSTGDAVFTIDAALSYILTLPSFQFGSLGTGEFFLQPAIEAHTSTNPKAQQDSISAKIPLQFVLVPKNESLIASHYFAISPVYETDHAKNTETYGGDLFYSPTIPSLYIGSSEAISSLPSWIAFGWRPFVGIEGGAATQPPSTEGYKVPSEYARFVFKLHADLLFSNRFALALDFVHRTFIAGDDASFDYFEISPIYYFDEDQHFSIGVTYKNGYTTPQFSKVDSLSAWLGLKF
jgi:hypothetical protein